MHDICMTWASGSIENSNQPSGGRGLELYEAILGFNRNQLMRKNVLDLGAGPEVKLAKELHESGIDTRVTEFSPDFSNPVYANRAKKSHSHVRAIAGLGENLPFANGSFDIVLALHVLDHLSNTEDFLRLIREVSRTLKNNGQAYIGPTKLNYLREDIFYKALLSNSKTMDYVARQRVTLELQTVPEEYFATNVYHPAGFRVGLMGGNRLILKKQP